MPAARAVCEECGARMPRAARFCPDCGRPAGDVTAIEEMPPDETGPVPVHVHSVEPRWFGLTPGTAILILASAALGAAVFVLATGHVLAGALLLAAAAVQFALFLAATRARPDVSGARASAPGAIRARAAYAVETLAAQGSARVEFFRLRRELVALVQRRGQALHALGDAVYREDAGAADEARSLLRALDGEIAQREGRMQTIVENARERIRQARLEVQPTEIRSFDPPVPVPEPGPVPSPPVEPPLIPEPTPEPSPPVEPPMIPEPTPAPTEPTPGAEHGEAR